MLNGERPQRDVVATSLVPVKRNMYHERPHHIHYGLDGSFSSPILVFGTDAREGLALMLIIAILAELGGGKNAVIAMILTHLGACQVIKPLFESIFRSKSVGSAKGHLVLNSYRPGRSIIKDGATVLTVMIRFPSEPCH
jgi:hypothetical protein